MAELAFEAPLAQIEGEEWSEFNEYNSAKIVQNLEVNGRDESEDSAFGENFSDKISKSLEDLVNTFDEKITTCFRNYEENVEKIAPVQVQSQEELLKNSQTWWTLTGNFGSIMPIDWTKSVARQLQEKALHIGEKKESDSSDLDISDDEELRQSFDYHSMIVSQPDLPQELQDFPALSADQVISEIENMMADDTHTSALDGEHLSPRVTPTMMDSNADLTVLNDFKFGHQTKEGLSQLSALGLNEIVSDMEVTIRNYSEVLICDLALRDELIYEKELKNSFISLLLDVQKKRREAASIDKKHSNRRSMPAASSKDVNNYLTTLIPYPPHKGPPTVEQLQIYIKILTAIRDNDPNVPALLTDYILRVLCPTI